MKNRIIAVMVAALAAIVPFWASAEVASFQQVWDDKAANDTITIETARGSEAQVTISGAGGADGTVTVSVCPTSAATTCTVVATEVAPASAVTYVGTSSSFLRIALATHTVGTVDVYLVLKR